MNQKLWSGALQMILTWAKVWEPLMSNALCALPAHSALLPTALKAGNGTFYFLPSILPLRCCRAWCYSTELDSDLLDKRNCIFTQVCIFFPAWLWVWYQQGSQVLARPWILISALTRVKGTSLRASNCTHCSLVIRQALMTSWEFPGEAQLVQTMPLNFRLQESSVFRSTLLFP